MHYHDVEPLDSELWFAELEKLRARRARIDGEAPDALFRKALYLVQLTPAHFRSIIPARVDENTVEAFLDCGAYLSSAVSLIGDQAAVHLQRPQGSGVFTASIRLSDATAGGEGCDEDPAKALLGAWCMAVLALAPSGSVSSFRMQDREDDPSSPNQGHSTH